jgi:hypothetical protein
MKKLPSLAAMMLVFSCAVARADTPDTPDTLQKLYTDANYKDLVPKINKVLGLKGADAAQFKKYDLLVMKGDASLHLHSKAQAMEAFKSAASATTTADESSTAAATAELIRQSSPNLTYLRKTKTDKDDKPSPIDIVEPESRKLAFAALQTDLLAKAKPKMDAAIKSSSLTQIAQAATDKDLVTLKAVEIAATGTPANTQQMLGDLGTRLTALLDANLEQLGQRLSGDVDAVNNRVQSPKPGEHANPNVMSVPGFIRDVRDVDANAVQLSEYIKNIAPILESGTDLKAQAEGAKKLHEIAAKDLQDAKASGY